MNKKYILCPGDFVIFALVLLLAGVVAAPFFLSPGDAMYVEIRQDQALIQRVRLTEDTHEEIIVRAPGGGQNTVEIDGKRVRVTAGDCYDQVCVRTGWLTRAGQSAVCLPNRLIVKLTGQTGQEEVDAIVQ